MFSYITNTAELCRQPFDGSGNFNRALGPDTWQNDAAAGIKIKSDLHDANDNDLASGLSLTITKDGQSSPTADITLNGHKLTNVANPTSPQDAATKNWAENTLRVFSTGMQLTGVSTGVSPNFVSKAFLGFTEADMSLVGRKADPAATPPTLNRLAFNDKADGTGTDLMTINENGTVWGAMTIKHLPLKTTSGTYTKPAGLKYLRVKVQAGNGGGGYGRAAGSQASCGSGGGGGGMAEKLFAAADIPATVDYTVGTGGAAGNGATPTNATAGGASTFLGLSATGGGPGTTTGSLGSAWITAGGSRGVGSGGDLNLDGGNGFAAIILDPSGGRGLHGLGGGSPIGNAAGSVDAAGGQGANFVLATTSNGQPGGVGCIDLEEYY